ncbi:hypothetical protein HOT36_gp14 [Ralstonia phage RPSC1]|uniref:Uncharacterized protein n=1 Tax=Ralstonia phage RPSC1 TaxID=2041351 RepID=A0A2Z2U7V8_9CAUD|nr:hypothetical protein HOT36_gp14 [Ralstonia phage RPSC1]ATN92944.1 hypothetical protein RPSC1_13 [Ralstonia phage RPSC1]
MSTLEAYLKADPDGYLAAALIAWAWVMVSVVIPLAVYQRGSPTNHLKKFPPER